MSERHSDSDGQCFDSEKNPIYIHNIHNTKDYKPKAPLWRKNEKPCLPSVSNELPLITRPPSCIKSSIEAANPKLMEFETRMSTPTPKHKKGIDQKKDYGTNRITKLLVEIFP